MQKILADVLHTIGQAMLTPCLIVLALLMIAALWQIGDVLVEWFKVRRTHKLKVTELIKAIHNSAETDGNAAITATVVCWADRKTRSTAYWTHRSFFITARL